MHSTYERGRRPSEFSSNRGGWDKLVGGVKWSAPPVRYLTKKDGITQVSTHSSLLGLTPGWSFLFSWWGGYPTNFGFCHTNFMACHTNFRPILKFSGFEMITLTISYARI